MADFQIDVAEDTAAEMAALPAFTRKQVVEAIDAQLLHQPTVQTRNRKLLRGLVPPWEHLDAIWEIRVGEYRVFYDVDESCRRSSYSGRETQAAASDNRRHFMKTLDLAETNLEHCLKEASSESVLVIKNGKPLALISNVEGLDAEQIELGTSADFWKLIEERRRQKTISWNQFKQRLGKLDG